MNTWYMLIASQVLFFGLTCGKYLELKGATAKCENEGSLVVVPVLSNTPCVQCYCRNGVTSCEKDRCLSTKGCHMIMFNRPKDACCDVCKGCWHNGTFHESGSTWSDPSDPCENFTCKAGVVTSSTTQCYAPCKNPIRVLGQCCPVCSQCTVGGISYTPGQRFRLSADKKCITCLCKEDGMRCSKLTCPVLNCAKRSIHTPEGACCPVCEGSRQVFDLPRRCLFRYKVYKTGQSVAVDKCTRCTCQEGTTVCRRRTCPALACPLEDRIRDFTSCCSRCKVRTTLPCNVDGNVYKHGDVWKTGLCTSCSCYDGQADCSTEQCPNTLQCPKNHHLAPVPGECCPRCVERDAVCSVFGDPHYRTFDGRLFTFQGTCKYILAKDCAWSNFTVGVRNQNKFRRPFAWTKSVYVDIQGHKIVLLSNHVVKVQKRRVKLPFVEHGAFYIEKDDRVINIRSSIGLSVSWNGESFLEVSVPSVYKKRLCGMCGNYNGVGSDDFTGPDNKLYADGDTFGNSWRYGSEKSCSRKKVRASKTSPCHANFSKWRQAHKSCAAIKSQEFDQCSKDIDVSPFYNSCLTDVCNCPMKHSCACDSITAYAHACKQAGFSVQWSRLSECPVF